MWNKKEGRGKCRLQHRQGTRHSEIQFVDTGTWALRWEVAGERIFTPSTKSTDRGAPHGSVPAQALLNISVSNLNDRTESTLCKFAASLQTTQNREERLVGQMAVLPFGGIWAGWRNKPAGNSQRLTGGNAKSYTWWTALQKKRPGVLDDKLTLSQKGPPLSTGEATPGVLGPVHPAAGTASSHKAHFT